ncbi:MAG: WecB/TagA/CpsF family glycosyltransferase [Nitrospiraceae bacterium]|nr:WecB/TagA/CpsF family glycosyltransferase [Nitrospiraceae bacterium]
MDTESRGVCTSAASCRCAQGEWPVVPLFGMYINSIGLRQLFEAVDARIAERTPGYIVTPNVDHVCLCQEDEDFGQACRNAFLVLPDGVPIVWASRLLGKPLQRKLSGSDLIYWMTEHAAKRGYSVFFLGAGDGVADEVAKRLKARYPDLRVAGSFSPAFGFEKDAQANAAVTARVREAAPDICYVALGSPKQEVWMSRYFEDTGAPVLLGVGGSFDFVAGLQKRAPRLVQRVGMEWLWRLCHDPLRLWRRYLVRDMKFFALVWQEWRKGRAK